MTKKAGNLNLIEPLLLLLGHGLPPLGALLGELAEFDLVKRERYRLGGNLTPRGGRAVAEWSKALLLRSQVGQPA